MMARPVPTRNPMRVSIVFGLAAAVVSPVFAQTARPADAPQADAAPQSADQLFQRARAAAVTGQREDALTLYGELLARNPAHADARLGRGRTYAWLRRWPAPVVRGRAAAGVERARRATVVVAGARLSWGG